MSRLKDKRNILRKTSFSKVTNLLVLRLSFLISKITRRSYHRGMPYTLSVEPTTACNLSCPECPSGLKKFSRPVGNMKQDLNKKIIDQLEKNLWYINFYFQGEPYINPSFLQMVRYASQKNIYTSASTNAHFLDDERSRLTIESGLDRLIISIDGTTQETYENYRIGGSLDKVINGTKNILYWKKKLNSSTPHVIFQFLVVKPNEHQVPAVFDLANELGVGEVRLKTAQVYDFENGNPLIPENEDYSRYVKMKNGKFRLKNKMVNHCWRMWSSCVITWDGKVVPCCFDKDAAHQLGRLSHSDFRTIWNSPSYDSFRNAVLTARNEIDICKNCSEGSRVWVS